MIWSSVAIPEFYEDLAKQLAVPALPLLVDRLIDLLLGDDSLVNEHLTDVLSHGCRFSSAHVTSSGMASIPRRGQRHTHVPLSRRVPVMRNS